MKKLLLLLSLSVFIASCSDDDDAPVVQDTENKALLLQIDFNTYVFEGGKEIVFQDAADFTINTTYIEPGDFGSLTLMYEQTSQKIFDGTITWNGMGQRSYPVSIDGGAAFTTSNNSAQISPADVEYLQYDEYFIQPGNAEQLAILAAINHLDIVRHYRAVNPNAKVTLFLYAPAVGLFDAASANWFLILKN